MTDEAKLRDQMDRGERAEFVLKQLEEAFKALEQQCFDAFRHSDMHDDLGRRAARYYLRVMDDVRSRFEHFVLTGKNAQKELVRMKDPSRWRKIVNG